MTPRRLPGVKHSASLQMNRGGRLPVWLPDDFVHPVLVPLPGSGHHLRPIREADTPLDYPAVTTMTYEADQAGLLRHEKEIAAHQSFNHGLFDAAETAGLCLRRPTGQGRRGR